MAHYAKISDNKVVNVFVGIDETETAPDGYDTWEDWYGRNPNYIVKRTSYNTHENVHTEDGTPFRGNYAGIGFTYDEDNDVFYPPQPYPSWTLSANWAWEAPISKPDNTNIYEWNEIAYQADNTTGWELIQTV